MTQDSARFASVGGDKVFFLWDVGTGRVVRRFTGHEQMINTVAFNAVGNGGGCLWGGWGPAGIQPTNTNTHIYVCRRPARC